MRPRRELREALGHVSLKAVSLGLERVCRLLVVVTSAPVLGPTAFGRFVFASTVTALLALGTDLGLGIWTTRALARKPDDGSAIAAVGLACRGLAALPYGLAIGAVALLVVDGETRGAIAALGIAALLNAFVDHFGAILRGYERFKDEARLNGMRALLTAAFGFVALEVGHSLPSLCLALAAASLGSCMHGTAIFLGLHPRTRAPHASFEWSLARAALRESMPIWLGGLLSLLYFKMDTVFLRFMAGDSELGAYGAAYKFFEGAMIVPAVLLAVAFPRLARAHGDAAAQKGLEQRLAALLFGLGVLGAAACFFGGTSLVRVAFGPGFDRAVASLRVLAWGLPLLYLNFGLTHFLVARNRGRATSILSLAMLILNVALNWMLIPRRAAPGAAWATVLTEVALTAGCLMALLGIRAPRLAPAATRRALKAR